MTTTSTAMQKPIKGNGAAKQAAVMTSIDLPPGDDQADGFQAKAVQVKLKSADGLNLCSRPHFPS